MKRYICIKKCFFGARLWSVGEVYTSPSDSAKMCKVSFKELKGAVAPDKKEFKADEKGNLIKPEISVDGPKSFSEVEKINKGAKPVETAEDDAGFLN